MLFLAAKDTSSDPAGSKRVPSGSPFFEHLLAGPGPQVVSAARLLRCRSLSLLGLVRRPQTGIQFVFGRFESCLSVAGAYDSAGNLARTRRCLFDASLLLPLLVG